MPRGHGRRLKSKTGVTGVYFTKNGARYVAIIKYKRVKHFLGTFDDIKVAAKAYDKKSVEFHGADAVTNDL